MSIIFSRVRLLNILCPVLALLADGAVRATAASEPPAGVLSQGYVIARQGAAVIALGDLDRQVLFQSTDAAEVIQLALDRLAQDGGGRLEIRQGRYAIRRKLELPASVSVVGAGKATVFLLDPENARGDGIIFHAVNRDHIFLADFACVGAPAAPASSAVVFDGCGFSTIRNVYAHQFSGCGFHLKGHSFANLLDGNFTSRNGRAGTLIEQTSNGRGGRFVPNTITGCTSYAEDGHGFEFLGAICQNLVGCTVYLPKDDGIYMHKSTSNLISACRVFMGFRNGITIEDTHEMNITGNIVGWNSGVNLVLNHCVWGAVTGNEFIDSGGRKAPQYSVHLRRGTKSVQLSGNAVFNWHDNHVMKGGILEESDCLENQITNNVINYYRDFAVQASGRNTVATANLGLPHPYGSPKAPNVPNVRPEDIKLHLDIDDSRAKAEALVATWFAGQ